MRIINYVYIIILISLSVTFEIRSLRKLVCLCSNYDYSKTIETFERKHDIFKKKDSNKISNFWGPIAFCKNDLFACTREKLSRLNQYGYFQCVQKLKKYSQSHFNCLTFYSPHLFASGDNNGIIRIWREDGDSSKTGNNFSCIHTLDATQPIDYLAWSTKEDILVSGSQFDMIKIWKMKQGKYTCIQTLDKDVSGLTFDKDDRLILFFMGHVEIWEHRDNVFELIKTLERDEYGCLGSVIYDIEHDLYISCWFNTITIEEMIENKMICVQKITLEEGKKIEHIAFLDDGYTFKDIISESEMEGQLLKQLVCFSNNFNAPNYIEIFDQNKGEFKEQRVMNVGWKEYSVMVPYKDNLVVLRGDEISVLHEHDILQPIQKLYTKYDSITSLVFHKTGLLASGSRKGKIYIWEKDKDEIFTCIQTLDANSYHGLNDLEPVTLLAWAKNGTLVSYSSDGGDGHMKIWKMKDDKFTCTQTEYKVSPEQLIFDKNDRLIIIDSHIAMWEDIDDTFTCIQKIHGGKIWGNPIYDPESTYIVSWWGDTIKIGKIIKNKVQIIKKMKKGINKSDKLLAFIGDKQESIMKEDLKERIAYFKDNLYHNSDENAWLPCNIIINEKKNLSFLKLLT